MTNDENIECFVQYSVTGLPTHIDEPNFLNKKATNYIKYKWDLEQSIAGELSLNDIKSVEVEGQYYEKLYIQLPNNMEGTDYLVLRIIEGPVSLFRHDLFVNGSTYYLQKDRISIDVKRRGFKTDMGYFFKEDQYLVKLIKSGDLKYNDIIRIVEMFNRYSDTTTSQSNTYK